MSAPAADKTPPTKVNPPASGLGSSGAYQGIPDGLVDIDEIDVAFVDVGDGPTNPYLRNIYPGAALIATGLSLHGLRSGSLSKSGAIAAWIVGYGHLANPLKLFGTTLIAFYLLGSRATKVDADIKATLEDGPDPAKPGGNRDWVQVLSNSLPSLTLALLYRLTCWDAPRPLLMWDLPRRIIFATLGHFATCMGDTLASELGILSPDKPTHILTGRTVPPGTNGGISAYGLGASALGGLIMGAVMLVDLSIEDMAIRRVPPQWGSWALLGWGTMAGFCGSLLDSIIGGALQQTLYSTVDSKVLTDFSERDPLEPGLVTIGPGKNWLSNSAVNLITSSIMAVAGWNVGGW